MNESGDKRTIKDVHALLVHTGRPKKAFWP